MEAGYSAVGVRRFLVDGPSLRGDTSHRASGRWIRRGVLRPGPRGHLPGVVTEVRLPRPSATIGTSTRWDHPSGLKPSRVTGKHIAPEDKRPYDAVRAVDSVRQHAKDFVDTVVRRLRLLRDRHGRPALVVAAYDTELYGHWWHEGPAWLEAVLRALPEAGVRVTSLRGALDAGHLGAPVELPPSSWGSGKDWRVWDGERVADLVDAGAEVQRELLSTIDSLNPAGLNSTGLNSTARNPAMDQLLREALLALSSDWAFMVTKDSATDYALRRAKTHGQRCTELAWLLRHGQHEQAQTLATLLRAEDGLFGHLDARGLLLS